jgi:Uri superfamily endonuclease
MASGVHYDCGMQPSAGNARSFRLTRRDERGSYLLVLLLQTCLNVEIGRLGLRSFVPGVYVYTGSALGPGGAPRRIERHLSARKKPRWHIDYLDAVAPIIAVSVAYGTDRLECAWSRRLATLTGCYAPVPGFGNSDCREGCAAHLWRLPDALPLAWLETELTKCPIHPTLYRPSWTR